MTLDSERQAPAEAGAAYRPGSPGARPSTSSHIVCVAVIALSVLLVYSNTFSVPFIFDDEFIIQNKGLIHDLSSFWPPSGSRYFAYLTFALNYHFGGLDVLGYHIVNTAVHILNAVVVYLLVLVTFRTPRLKAPHVPEDGSLAQYTALAAAVLFAVHPIQTGAVTYIVQRVATLATLFYLLSVLFYAASRTSRANGGPDAAPGAGHGAGIAFYILSLVSGVLAMKTKEISFTLPFVVILYELAFFDSKGAGKRALRLVPYLLLLPIIPLSVVALKAGGPAAGAGGAGVAAGGAGAADAGIVGRLTDLPTKETEGLSRYNYLITQFRVVVKYLRLLVLPINQNLDYDYPHFRSFKTPEVFLSFIFLLVVFAGNAWIFFRSIMKKRGLLVLASAGVLWFFITLSIESSIIPIKDAIFEHRLYLPSVGAAVTFTSAALYGVHLARARLGLKVPLRSAAIALLVITALPLAVSAHLRNRVWQSPITLYEDIINKSPGNPRAHNNLGIAYKDAGLLDKAAAEFRTTLRLKPSYFDTHMNLGNIYQAQGRYEEAAIEYDKFVRLVPDSIEGRELLGAALVGSGRYEPGAAELLKVIKRKPGSTDAHSSLAEAYFNLGLTDKAIAEFHLVLSLEPGRIEARNNLANVYYLSGRLSESIREYERVLSLVPGHVETHYNLGIAYKDAGNIDKAVYHFQRFVELAPPEYLSYAQEVRGRIDELKRGRGR